jgi:hypothetical protein
VRRSIAVRSSAILFALVASCTTTFELPDGGPASEGGVDAPSRPPRGELDAGGSPSVYTPCLTQDECPGTFCNLDYPQGICTPHCSSHAECPENGFCEGGLCRPRCQGGANECRNDMFCDAQRGVCYPSCSARPDATVQRCPTFGDECQSSSCASWRTPPPVALGLPCTSGAQCANRECLLAAGGWPRGTCTQYMRAPGAVAWLAEGPLPSGGCLDAFAVVPLDGSEGDLAACVPRCMIDDDCRDGYRCDHHVLFDGPEHTDGACVPWWCAGPFVVPCSPDRTCMPFSGTLNACFRSPP